MQIIIPHTNTDLDALGAAVGAQVLYPNSIIVIPGVPNPTTAEFISLHRYNLRVRTPREVDLSAVTHAIVVDTADPARLGPMQEIMDRVEVHLYDHHPVEANDLRGTVEIRDQVGATCTLMAELIEESGAPITPLQATAVLLGIYADTGSLTLTGTTERDARAAAFLLGKGANLRAMARFIQGTLSPAQHALLQQLQSRNRLVNVRGNRIRILEGETPEYVGGMALVVHRLQELLPAPALFAAVKMADRVHVVARSDVPWIDCASAMAVFGGGGHKAAASAQVKGARVEDIVATLEAVLPSVMEQPISARDVMTTPVKSITPDKPVRDAERIMLRYGHSGLPVVDENGGLLGVLSLRDVEKARRHGLDHAPVKGMMNRHPVTVQADMPLDQIQELMVEKDIGRVPVVDGGNVIGIISRSDLLGLLYGGPAPRWHTTLFAGHGHLLAAADADEATRAVQEGAARLPKEMQALLRAVGLVSTQIGQPCFVVGGFVRDLLLGHPNFDMDVVVEGDGLPFARTLNRALGGQLKEVARFGTAHILLPGHNPNLPAKIDVATARREYYEHAAALPVVEHADLREDLYRRDFSINAMAARLGPDGPVGLVDFFGGLQDLQSGQIRILHSLSFVEDPTRIIRAIRFAQRYGFSLDAETAREAAKAVAGGYMSRVSAERLRNELVLLLQEPGSGGALGRMAEVGALQLLLPKVTLDEITCERLDRVDQLEREMPDLSRAAQPYVLKLMILLNPLPLADGVATVHGLKLRREATQPLLHVLAGWRLTLDAITSDRVSRAERVRLLNEYTPEGLLLIYLLGGGDIIVRYWREWRHLRLAINGEDVLAAGVPQGPALGKALARVLTDLLDGSVGDRQSQLRRAVRYALEEA